MAYPDFNWADLPNDLQQQDGELPSEWRARLAAYVLAHPGVLTLLDAATLEAFGAHVYAAAVADAPGGGAPPPDATTSVKGLVRITPAPASATAPTAVGNNHPALSDARPPTAHGHVQSDITGLATALQSLADANAALDAAKADADATSSALAGKQSTTEKGQPGGYASLDGTGKVPASQLPAASGGSSPSDGTTIGVVALNGSGEPEITFASVWGIDAATGEPYYDPVGAVGGEDALLMADQATGDLFLIQPTGVTP